MVRTQIQLHEEQYKRLSQTARVKGLSLSEVIRRCVDTGLEEIRGGTNTYNQLIETCRAFRDDTQGDVAAKHDEYLAKAYR